MRVVSGELGGRTLHVPVGRATRPTSDRAREGVFAWLGPRVHGCSVLDLFAGSGALGIEALSRGAEHAVFVEVAKPAIRALRRNLRELQLEGRSRVLARPVRRALSILVHERARFDLVMADPPYASNAARELLQNLDLTKMLVPDGILILERPTERGEIAASDAPEWGRESLDSVGPRSTGSTCWRPQRGPHGRLALIETRAYGSCRFEWYAPSGPEPGLEPEETTE